MLSPSCFRFWLWCPVVLLASVPLVGQAGVAPTQRPNIIVIMADDLGYGDVSAYGATALSTPNIDQLAKEGLRFTQGYCSASTCTPTRFSFLTGTYAFREPNTGIAPPESPLIIDPATQTLPSALRDAGYATAVIGKWHLGLGGPDGPDWNGALRPGPQDIGFDYNFILPTTNDRVPQVYVEGDSVLDLDPRDPLWVGNKAPSAEYPTGINQRDTLRMNWSHGHNGTIHNGISRIGFYTGGTTARFRDEDLADAWIDHARKWIETPRDKPFFLFFASHDVHVPRMPHERFQGTTSMGLRGDSIMELDWSVGALRKILADNDLTDSTLIVFCSDNGPVMDDGYQDGSLEKVGLHRAGGPFTGGKYSVYEGGTRTPFITWWPGHIEPGVSSQMVCTIDLANSLVTMAGGTIRRDAFRDSQNVWGALVGEPAAIGRTELIQQDNGSKGNFGFRVGDWKLVRHDSRKAFNTVVEGPLTREPVARYQLFNMPEDPGETQDIIETHPVMAAQLISRLEALITADRSR